MASYIFESQRLGFRRWNDADLGPFQEMNMDPKVMEFFPNPLNPEQTKEYIQRIKHHFESYGFGLYAVDEKSGGDYIGFIGMQHVRFESFFTPAVEIGYRLIPKFWGKGYASEGGRKCLSFAFQELHLDRIVSFTSTLNTKSERVMQSIGMTRLRTFDHPLLPEHRLQKHVLYEIKNVR